MLSLFFHLFSPFFPTKKPPTKGWQHVCESYGRIITTAQTVQRTRIDTARAFTPFVARQLPILTHLTHRAYSASRVLFKIIHCLRRLCKHNSRHVKNICYTHIRYGYFGAIVIKVYTPRIGRRHYRRIYGICHGLELLRFNIV